MSFLRRALAGASATVVMAGALVAGSAAPAAAESSSFCPHATSTRLFTANNGQYKVWLYKTVAWNGADEYHLCYASSPEVAGDLVVSSGLGGSLVPTITPTVTDTTCPDFFTFQDPVQLVTELGTYSNSVCFGVGNNSAIRVTFGLPSYTLYPRFELWVDRYTTVGRTYCKYVNDYQCYYGTAVRVV